MGSAASQQNARRKKTTKARDLILKKRIENVGKINGLSAIHAHVDDHVKNGCKLSNDGITVFLNPFILDDIATRNWHGARESISLRVVETIAAFHEVGRAVDFTDPTYFIELDPNPNYPDRARRFFNSTVDDIAVGLKIKNYPLIKKHYKAFLSRQTSHVMTNHPLHIQFMYALKLYVLEEDPALVISPYVVDVLGCVQEPSPLVMQFSQALQSQSISYEERHRVADETLYDMFKRFLVYDQQIHRAYELLNLYDEFPTYGDSKESFLNDYLMQSDEQVRDRAKKLFDLVGKQDVEKMIEDRKEKTEEASAGLSVSAPVLPEGSALLDSFGSVERDYRDAIVFWHNTIEQVASVFIELAFPQEEIAVPRYKARVSYGGVRLNPHALLDAEVQLRTGHEKAIWQPVHKLPRMQNLHFNGLDVYLLLDVSTSMEGEKADYAAALWLCLIEGIQLAQYRVGREVKQGTVDVRAQAIAFGAGWRDLVPLARTQSLEQKAQAYHAVLNPLSEQTMIGGALRHVSNSSQDVVDRDTLCLIVSDGLFADNLNAYKIVQGMPKNAYVGHINIGAFAGIPITPHYEMIHDPSVLPEHLYKVLSDRIKQH